MAIKTAPMQEDKRAAKYSAQTFCQDTSPTVTDPIYACVGQSVDGLYSNRMFKDNDTCNLQEESAFWVNLVEFGLQTKTLSKKTAKTLEDAIDNNGIVNVSLLQSASEIQSALSHQFKALIDATETKLQSRSIVIPEHLQSWINSDWAYRLDINNACEFGEGEEATTWAMRIEAGCGLAAFSIESLRSAPPMIKGLGGELIDILCRYSHKIHSGWLRHLPGCYSGLEELEDSMRSEIRQGFLDRADDPEISNREAVEFLLQSNADVECIGWLMDDPETAFDELEPYVRQLVEAEYLECKETSELPLKERLTRLEQQLKHLQDGDKTLVDHPLFLRIQTLCTIALEVLDTSACLNDASEILGFDIDMGSIISTTPSDETYLEMCNRYQMETGEQGVREVHLDNPAKTLAALKNMVVSELLLLAIDVADQ